MTRKIDIHQQLCYELHSLYAKKNADYGDSFAKVREEIPHAILVRLHDKLNRLKKLMLSGEPCQISESIDDTLMDLANYALLELVERRYEAESIKEEHFQDCWDRACEVAEEREREKEQQMLQDRIDALRNYVVSKDTSHPIGY